VTAIRFPTAAETGSGTGPTGHGRQARRSGPLHPAAERGAGAPEGAGETGGRNSSEPRANTADSWTPRPRSQGWEKGSRPISRILSARAGRTAIHLGPLLPTASVRSTHGLRTGRPRTSVQGTGVPLLTLLRVGFTEPTGSLRPLVVSYTTVSPLPPARGGGLFSVALSRGSPRVGVTDHPALWSPDFPRHRAAVPRPSGRLPFFRFYVLCACPPAVRRRSQDTRWPVSLRERTTIGPSLKQWISHRHATSRCIRYSACNGASMACCTSTLIGVTWLTTSTVRPR